MARVNVPFALLRALSLTLAPHITIRKWYYGTIFISEPKSFSGRQGGSIYWPGTTLINYSNSIKIDRRPGGVGVETRGAAADNILACSSFMTRGYEPGRAITPRIFPALVSPSGVPRIRGKARHGCQFLAAYRTINWKRDVCYLTLSNPLRGATLPLLFRGRSSDSVRTLARTPYSLSLLSICAGAKFVAPH